MADLAELGLRIQSEEVATADQRLDAFSASASQADAAVDKLAAAARGLGGALLPTLQSIDGSVREMLALARAQTQAVGATVQQAAATADLATDLQRASTAGMMFRMQTELSQSSMGGAAAAARDWGNAIQQADSHVLAYRTHLEGLSRSMGQQNSHVLAYRKHIGGLGDDLPKVGKGLRLTAQDGLNFSRQMADIGVTAAMGMNPLMIALQQGPQLFDILQTTAIRSGMSIRATMAATGAVIWTALAPLLPVIAALAAAAAVAAGAWAIASNEIGKATGDVTKGMGLAEEQLDRLEKANVKTSATMGDAFKAFGTTVKESVQGVLANELAALKGLFDDAYSWIVRTTGEVVKFNVGSWVGALYAIRTAWSVLPGAMGDIVVTAANAVLKGIEDMVNGAIDRLKAFAAAAVALAPGNPLLTAMAGGLAGVGHVDLPEITNANAGRAEAAGEEMGAAFHRGYARGIAGLDRFVVRFLENLDATTRARVLEAAGDPNKGRSGSDVNSDLKRIQQYIESLNDQANTMGLSAIAAKAYEINTRALEAAEYGLEAAVRAAGAALLEKMRIEAADMDGKADQLEYLRLEGSLIAASNSDRTLQLGLLRERQRLLAAGVDPDSEIGRGALDAMRQILELTNTNRVQTDLYNDSLRVTLDLMRQIDDHARDAANGLANAFGQQGRALGDLLTTMTDYQARLAEIAEAEDRMRREGTLSAERQAMFERDRAQATVGAYGDMISAARGYFREGSDGYKALLIAEQIYRAFQFASSVQAMAQGGIETATSIAQSGAKGVASMAAGAAKMFEMLGPLGFPAVAAMLGLLAGLGLAGGKGGGGGRSAANDNDPNAATDAVRANSARETQGREAAAASVAQAVRVQIELNDPMFTARVRGEAVNATAPLVAAAAAGTKRDVMQTLQGQHAGNRRNVV